MVNVTDCSDIDMRFCSFKLLFCHLKSLLYKKANELELLSRLELPNLFITNEVLYRLSYSSISIMVIILYFVCYVNVPFSQCPRSFFLNQRHFHNISSSHHLISLILSTIRIQYAESDSGIIILQGALSASRG